MRACGDIEPPCLMLCAVSHHAMKTPRADVVLRTAQHRRVLGLVRVASSARDRCAAVTSGLEQSAWNASVRRGEDCAIAAPREERFLARRSALGYARDTAGGHNVLWSPASVHSLVGAVSPNRRQLSAVSVRCCGTCGLWQGTTLEPASPSYICAGAESFELGA